MLAGGFFYKRKIDLEKNRKTSSIEASKLKIILDEWNRTQNSGCIKDFDVSLYFYSFLNYTKKIMLATKN